VGAAAPSRTPPALTIFLHACCIVRDNSEVTQTTFFCDSAFISQHNTFGLH
jgi:hypothetical protein